MAGMQRCGEYNEILSAYLDGELSPAERIDLLQHLASCPACRDALDEYRAIGTRLRGLPPVLVPESLTASVYMHTVDAPPRRLQILTNRLAYPVAAIAAVLLVFIVAVFLLVDGYQSRIEPSIVGSSPSNGVMWSMLDPIRITFNKEMDRQSVENALAIVPTSERDRLEITWEGNTLIIGDNGALRPGTSYSVTVTSEARDKWGNRLSESFNVGFTTNQTVTLDASPTPRPSPTPSPEVAIAAEATATPRPDATPTTQSDGGAPTSDVSVRQGSVETPTTETGSSGSEEDSPPPPPQQEPPPPPPDVPADPTSTPAPPPPPPPPPTETPFPVPTEEPVAISPTEEPEPTATPEPEPEPSPTEVPATEPPAPEPTPTPAGVAITGAFSNVYWRNEEVRDDLGKPVAAEHAVGVLELDFQHGKMMRDLASGDILVMHISGFWEFVPDTSAGELPAFVEVDEAGLWEPGGVFGYIWHEDSYVSGTLGLAVSEKSHTYDSLTQSFETGTMYYSAEGFIYVLYDNGRWELYPDAGPLSDDTSG